MVSQQLIQELKTIIYEDYRIDVCNDEAAQIAEDLVNYFELLSKISFREEADKNKNANKEEYENRIGAK
jgi:hypothetical protein